MADVIPFPAASSPNPAHGGPMVEQSPVPSLANVLEAARTAARRGGEYRRNPIYSRTGAPTGDFTMDFATWPDDRKAEERAKVEGFEKFLDAKAPARSNPSTPGSPP